VVGVISGGVLVSAVAYCVASLVLSSQVPWIQFAFESVVIGACVMGLLFAFGKFQWAPAMTVVCVAGTIAVASVLVYRGMLGQVQIAGKDRGWSLMPWVLGRLGASVVLAVLAGAAVVSRDPRSRASLVRGFIASVPLVLSAGGFVVVWMLRSGGWSQGAAASMPAWLSTGLMTCLGIAAGVSLCAAGHYFIRAFEIGSDVAEGRSVSDDAKA
jgi:hypothetical protein